MAGLFYLSSQPVLPAASLTPDWTQHLIAYAGLALVTLRATTRRAVVGSGRAGARPRLDHRRALRCQRRVPPGLRPVARGRCAGPHCRRRWGRAGAGRGVGVGYHQAFIMTFDNLLFERDGAVAILTFNRPKVLNALNAGTLRDLDVRARRARRRRRGQGDHPHGRRREVLRRRGGHQRAGGADAGGGQGARPPRSANLRPHRAAGQAGDCGHQRLRAGGRM